MNSLAEAGRMAITTMDSGGSRARRSRSRRSGCSCCAARTTRLDVSGARRNCGGSARYLPCVTACSMVSDEIHGDFTCRGTSITQYLRRLGAAVCSRTAVICTAPCKTFNLAGLQVSNIFVPDPELRQTVSKETVDAAGYSQVGSDGTGQHARRRMKTGAEWLAVS